jgi:hypothetical protein
MNENVHKLEERQARDIRDFEMKQKEMDAKIAFARDNLEGLKRRYEIDKEDLEGKQVHLQKLQAQAKLLKHLGRISQIYFFKLPNLAEKHNEESSELESYIEKLDEKAVQEREKADQLLEEYQKLQDGKLISLILIAV